MVIDGATAGANPTIPFVGLIDHGSGASGVPKAYLTMLMFDLNYNLVNSAFKQIGSSAEEDGTDVNHEYLSISPITIEEAGYVYIYLSNENGTPIEVFFDDFKVTHTSTDVVQKDDYYPFGLTFNSYTNIASMAQNYLYQGKELIEDSNLNIYDFHAWGYDPVIGRTMQIDPHAENYFSLSPNSWTANNPINVIDPTGRDTLLINGQSGRILDTRTGGEDYVYWTGDESVGENTWKNSSLLTHSLDISGDNGGSESKKGAPVVWSNLQDHTDEFSELLEEAVTAWENYRELFENQDWYLPGNEFLDKSRFFYSQVDDDKPFDIKSSSFHPKYKGEWSFYEGKLVRYDDYGNILYGAIGSAFGFSPRYLQIGANINQLGKTGLDDGKDTYSINYGIQIYKKR